MIKEIYRDYFQKSQALLYPLLGFTKSKHQKPIQTYIAWKDYIDVKDKSIICLYDTSEVSWISFEEKMLISHAMLKERIPLDDTTVAYVFDLTSFASDYDRFIKGEYSKYSDDAKSLMSSYYGVHTANWIYIESFLYPSKYYKDYAEILNVDISLLEEVVELCQYYDEEKETLLEKVPEKINF